MSQQMTLSKSYCVLPFTAAAVDGQGNVVPCCRWYPYGITEDTPNIKYGLKNARNSKFWQTIRQQMIDGEYPTGCKICWDNESKGGERAKYRMKQKHIFSDNSPYGSITTIDNSSTKLRYLETGISNLCNFACVMCTQVDSSIIHSILRPGEKIPKGFHKDNENIDDDLSELQVLKLVGGEPMIEKKHDELLEKVISLNNNPSNLEIHYHTNVSIFPSERVINCWKKLKEVEIVLSIDGIGDTATLQRPGNYVWQDIEDTVNKYVQLTDEVNIVFSVNVVLTALNIGQITDICDWLYNKVEKNSTMRHTTLTPIHKQTHQNYIDFRNLSKETKDRIKEEWKAWEATNPPVLNTIVSDLYTVAKDVINEDGLLAEPLTRELILEMHPNAALWKHFKEDLSLLNI
jgi:molybdenum cofactor biosynthesis enzyme MoaA